MFNIWLENIESKERCAGYIAGQLDKHYAGKDAAKILVKEIESAAQKFLSDLVDSGDLDEELFYGHLEIKWELTTDKKKIKQFQVIVS